MDPTERYLHNSSLSRSSSSSAVDLSGTSAGIVSSAPPSPSLGPSERLPRRRASWGKVDLGQDPLGFAPSTSRQYSVNDDPFYSPTDEAPFGRQYSYATNRYPQKHETSASQSSASLIGKDTFEMEDHARLTTNMSGGSWRSSDEDPEISPAARRRTLRYSVSPSPLKKTSSAIRSVGNNFRRVSLRVVNLSGHGLEEQIRLPDDDDEVNEALEPFSDRSHNLPIRGRTLCFLGPRSKIREWLYRFLTYKWTEPVILFLIIVNAVILTIQSAHSFLMSSTDNVPTPVQIHGYFHAWEDYALFIIFIVFTIEAFARISVSGLIFDPEISAASLFSSPFSDYSVPASVPTGANISSSVPLGGPLTRGLSLTQRISRLNSNLRRPFALTTEISTVRYLSDGPVEQVPSTEKLNPSGGKTFLSSAMHSSTHQENTISLPFKLSIAQSNDKIQRNIPYMRQSWNRIDFVAITSFWITFILATTGVERGNYHIGLFRALSVMRTARLLTITSGTTTIMHSLKTAKPLLASVAYFVLFAMVLFSIIGVQSFNGSLRRTCHVSSVMGVDEFILDGQFCGGYIDPVTLNETAYIQLDGAISSNSPKGYICPLGQVCREDQNPYDGIESYDTIYFAALQVVIVASANGWSPLMYATIDSEFFISSVFYIVCVVVLNFWLINLFVAVITNTFSAIRSETKKSAFGAAPLANFEDDQDDGWSDATGRKSAPAMNIAKIICDYTKWFWVLLALASLVLQATRSVDTSEFEERVMYWGELGITIAFDLEIVLRVLATLPDWRTFFIHSSNILDLALAISTSIIQIPAIQESSVYPWFTIFQLMRFYRVILEVPRMRPLLLAVFGNMYGLVNMSLFLLLVNYVAALIAVQFLRGDLTSDVSMNFGQIYTSFLAAYQVFSSENWTDVLYDSASAEISLGQSVITVLFVSGWLLFANFIMLQMFIAVINENFDVAEEAKKSKQATSYWETHQIQAGSATWLRRLNPYRWFKANPVTVNVENLPSNLVLPMQKALVQDYGVPVSDKRSELNRAVPGSIYGPRHYPTKSLTALQRLFAGRDTSNDVPLRTLKHSRGETLGSADFQDEETERYLELLASVNPQTSSSAEDISDALYERRAQKADFIRDHPTYDKTFWIFSQKNPVRILCQKLVQPAHGERIFGTPSSPIALPIFQLIILLAVIGGIVVESIATPSYRRNYYAEHGLVRGAWFDLAELAFGATLLVEFFIKIAADGFLFAPNAYIRSIWNVIDFIILIGIIVNVSTSLIFVGGLSRITRSLKALRALRLITLVDIMRTTFQSLIISGARRILDAAILAILYMIPYAVWGLNIFSGKMNECNDSDATGAADCINEFSNIVYGNDFAFLAPRAWDNPAPSTVFSFDSFKASLLILFEIVSLEGWIDVMNIATSITGTNEQPETNASQVNAIFFLIYNLLGGVVILTLFVSIIIGNFSSKTGSAFLTKAQREWIDLQKLFKRQRPSKRPTERPASYLRSWCYDRAVYKHGWWSRFMTCLFIVHIIALMTQTFTSQNVVDSIRNDFFLAVTFIYIIDVMIRFVGLGYTHFTKNGWNTFDVLVSCGSFVTTLIVRFANFGYATEQLQKLFLVSIAFKLVQRTNSLNKLFKTAMASLPVIVSLLGLWLILFIFFGILFVEVFGLTKWNSGENRNQNYSTMGSSLVMLAFMSTGEGWNQYMHDYTIDYPRCTNSSEAESDSDCGSVVWAFALFIFWNLLSMYIFVNMFTGVVVENFSYVFQTSTGGAKSITREQMRSFKKIWSEYANDKTGYLEKQHFVAFFARLGGVFEVRIYPRQHSIPNIMAASTGAESRNSVMVDRIDLGKLSKALDAIDYDAVRKRRATYYRLYHEASISHHQGRGISFTDMLMLLAHHKLIVDREALVLKDLVARNETNKLVTDLVNLDRVRSLLRTISHRRRFLAHLERKRQEQLTQEIPSIVVDVMPTTPPISSRDISSLGFGTPTTPSSPTPARYHGDMTISGDMSPGAGLHRSKRTSDISMLSADLGSRYPRDSISDEDPQQVLSSMQNSMWSDLMSEAMKEEEGRYK